MRIGPVLNIYNNQQQHTANFKGNIRMQSYEKFIAEEADEFIRNVKCNLSQNNRFKEGVEEIENLYRQFKEENWQIFSDAIARDCKDIARKIVELPGYSMDYLFCLVGKKKSELEYLYNIAKMHDITGEMRIPACTLPFFTNISTEKLKLFEPLMLSKNDCHIWNYSPSFIMMLDERYNVHQIEIMSKLAECKVNGMNLRLIAENPYLNHKKTIEKAQTLKCLYGENLREIQFLSNSQGNYLFADIQLPHRDDKPDWQNFRRVYTKLDTDVNPVSRRKYSADINSYIGNTYKNLQESMHVFSKESINRVVYNVLKSNPDATEEEVIQVTQRLTQFANYGSLKDISQALKEAGIERLSPYGGINPVFYYFQARKNLFELGKDLYSINQGVFITKSDLNNPELNEIFKLAKDNDMKFINLEGWSDGINLLTDDNLLESKVKIILRKAKKIMAKHSEYTFDDAIGHVLNRRIEARLKDAGVDYVTVRLDKPATVSNIFDQMKPIMPSESLLESTIEAIANHYAKNRKNFDKLCRKIANYYENNMQVFSKQRIIDDLKRINLQIREYLTENNLSEKNLYLLQQGNKLNSFTVIRKLYATLFDIPQDRFIDIVDINAVNKYPKNSVFLILDDVVGSGESMVQLGDYGNIAKYISGDKHILFCPVTATKEGLNYISSKIIENERFNCDKIFILPENTSSYINTANDFIDNDPLLKEVLGKKGHGTSAMCTVFPYMAPDNDSGLSSYIVKYFVPNVRCIKTKEKTLPFIEKQSYYYNIFGTDKDSVCTNYFKIFKKRFWDNFSDSIKQIMPGIF